jgi:GT2 family glycosyltransferase
MRASANAPHNHAAIDDVALIILNWNSAQDTTELIKGLPASWQSQIIVVDNGSRDWSGEMGVLGSHHGVCLLRRETNGGYAAGMNAGIHEAARLGYRKALLLNADSRPTPEAIEVMAALGREFDIVGIAQTAGRGQGEGNRYVTAATGRGLTPAPFTCPGCHRRYHQVDLVSGAAILIDLELAEGLGGLDEAFFHFKEEFDFIYRARLAGGRVAWVCTPSVPHAVGASLARGTNLAAYYMARNEVLFFRKHLGLTRYWLSPRLLRIEATFLWGSIRTRTVRGTLAGARDGIRGVQGMKAGAE